MSKAKKVFITIDFDWVSGIIDYPQNIPLPRIGETVTLEHAHGKVYDIRHNISGSVASITIKVKRHDQ